MLKKIVLWVLRLVPVVILMQTVILYKFPAHPESVELFNTLSNNALDGAVDESILRWSTGILEVIASLMLLITPLAKKGAILTLGVMAGAIASHVMFLGYGTVFIMAIIVSVCAVLYLLLSRALKS